MKSFTIKRYNKRVANADKQREQKKIWEKESQRKDVAIDEIEIRVNRKFSEEVISLIESTGKLKWCMSSSIRDTEDSKDDLIGFSFVPTLSVLRDGSDINNED